MLLPGCHLRKSTRHCPLLLEVVWMRLPGRRCKVGLHRHARLDSLMRAAMLHHRWSRTVVRVSSRTVLHMRHVWLSVWRHGRIILVRDWSIHVTL